jgi:hypothetical protein
LAKRFRYGVKDNVVGEAHVDEARAGDVDRRRSGGVPQRPGDVLGELTGVGAELFREDEGGVRGKVAVARVRRNRKRGLAFPHLGAGAREGFPEERS